MKKYTYFFLFALRSFSLRLLSVVEVPLSLRSQKGLFYVLISLSLFFPLSLRSQNVGGGLTLGTNFCQIDGDAYGGYNKIGIQAGGFAWYDFNEYVAMQIEILYDTKGARAQTAGSGTYHARLNYLDFPVLADVRLLGDRDQGLSLQGGFVPGYLLFARLGPNGLISTVTQNYRKFSFETTVGFSAEISPRISAVARWNYSLRDISVYADPTTRLKIVNRYVSLALRVRLK